MNSNREKAINVAIAAGRSPKVGRSGQTTINLKQREGKSSYALLSRADGSLTKAGEHYYKATGGPSPSRQFDNGAPLIKKGAGDYVNTRNGKLSLVRMLRPDGSTQVTRLGKQYFRGSKTEYVVSIPVRMPEGKFRIGGQIFQTIC